MVFNFFINFVAFVLYILGIFAIFYLPFLDITTRIDQDNDLISVLSVICIIWSVIESITFAFMVAHIFPLGEGIKLAKQDYIFFILSYASLFAFIEITRYLEYISNKHTKNIKLSFLGDLDSYNRYKMIDNKLIELTYYNQTAKINDDGYVLLSKPYFLSHAKGSGYFGKDLTRFKVANYNLRSGYREDYIVCDVTLELADKLKYSFAD